MSDKSGQDLHEQIINLIIDRLRLEEIEPGDIEVDAPLFGEGLGLDSIDALELVVGLEQAFKIQIPDADVGRTVLASVRAIGEYVEASHSEAKAGEV